MRVQAAAGERPQEIVADQLHEACQHHKVRFVQPAGGGQAFVPLLPAGEVRDPADERGDTVRGGTVEALAGGPVRADSHDTGAERRILPRIDQGLQVRPLPRAKHYEPRTHEVTLSVAGWDPRGAPPQDHHMDVPGQPSAPDSFGPGTARARTALRPGQLRPRDSPRPRTAFSPGQ